MRISTKIKHLLLKYKIESEMLDEGLFQMVLINKGNGQKQIIESKSYSLTIHDAYKILKKEI